ncbi:helix-turn-helix domain-containing protein [Flavobacterium arcticum]|uniref:Helix-turn-helix domain-containing protein n=1 Tax=Flavobacterium arcticum TaxID=1784713 RepID=A0A345HDU3_9FLAO|nr:helix-turn-helix transcriptional regulator [Flavobacterium arcticum]AXG74753.1 helix-turn-helix domain-containing protein [Flavobacterium arcticum]KAF2509747.1 helix-turn-helix domain-containing protein [Flavobacterium arcticum]
MNTKMSLLILIGNNIRRHRMLQGISQEELAYRSNLHRTYIGMIERAEKNITVINLEKISTALKIEITDLFIKKNLMRKIDKNIFVNDEYFIAEKTADVFKEVEFIYETKKWNGALPKFLEKQGLDLNDKEFEDLILENYQLLDPTNTVQWITESDASWSNKSSATYKVLAALNSGNWECRVCGPVPKVNPQPAARLSALKKRGYIIGSKRKICSTCNKKTMHDILIMLPNIESRFNDGNELRKPIPEILKKRIKNLLGHKEICFNVVRSDVELLIDHKFPSQRWNTPEGDNKNSMSDEEIKEKFQLLSNQTNMWKSRYCDTCVKTNIRGNFMGINWYYEGNENWEGKTPNDENGCIGCPWYDLKVWKSRLILTLND